MSTSNSLRRAVRFVLPTSVAAGAAVPSFAADQTIQEVANGATGTATVNMHGLGSARTLVRPQLHSGNIS
jgi:hypothetical protein